MSKFTNDNLHILFKVVKKLFLDGQEELQLDSAPYKLLIEKENVIENSFEP